MQKSLRISVSRKRFRRSFSYDFVSNTTTTFTSATSHKQVISVVRIEIGGVDGVSQGYIYGGDWLRHGDDEE